MPREGTIAVTNADLYYRDVGQGQPLVILHGGPDFNHHYLLPEMDRLADAFHLIYYDQRGRGRSLGRVQPEDVTIQSEIEDLEGVRVHYRLEAMALLGHSWGGLLAMEYATRHPGRVSHLILMNSAPASHDDLMLFRAERRRTAASDLDRMEELSATARYATGDLEMDAGYYRYHFKAAIRQPEHLERVVGRLRLDFTEEGIRMARAIEQRLYAQTWLQSGYNLFPRLKQLRIRTLVLHGEQDFCPVACATHIAGAIPEARLVVLKECGHFAYLERPAAVDKEMVRFFEGKGTP
jgi:proline iminopeptidase